MAQLISLRCHKTATEEEGTGRKGTLVIHEGVLSPSDTAFLFVMCTNSSTVAISSSIHVMFLFATAVILFARL